MRHIYGENMTDELCELKSDLKVPKKKLFRKINKYNIPVVASSSLRVNLITAKSRLFARQYIRGLSIKTAKIICPENLRKF